MATVAEDVRPRLIARPRPRFYAIVALLIAGFMVLGFGYELPKYVIRPNVQRPPILLLHSIVFLGWIILYLAQILLIQTHKIRLHRTLGWLGLALALIMPPLGIATALVMRHFNLTTFPSHDVPLDLAFLATPIADIIVFTPCAWIGIAMRKRPDYHRRLMYLATASIAEAGFGRLPIPGMGVWFYLGNLPIYFAGMIYDRVTIGHVHKVYLWMVPFIITVEAISMYLWLAHPAWWVATCRWLIGMN